MTVLCIHGFGASAEADWYPAIRPMLDEAGIAYVIPNMPDPSHPRKDAWLSTIKSAFDHIKGDVVLVGHSLGTRAALLFLESNRVTIHACLLVGAFANRIENGERRGSVYATFFDHSIDIPLVRSRCARFVVLHSEDDQSIPYEQGVSMSQDLGAELITESARHHFTASTDASVIFAQLMRLVH